MLQEAGECCSTNTSWMAAILLPGYVIQSWFHLSEFLKSILHVFVTWTGSENQLHYCSLQSVSKPVFWIIYLRLTYCLPKPLLFPLSLTLMSDSSTKQRSIRPFPDWQFCSSSKCIVPQNNQEKNEQRVFSLHMDTTGLSGCRRWQCFPDMADSKASNPSQEANALVCQFLQRWCVPCHLTRKHLDTPGSPRTIACSSATLFTVRAPSS